MSTEPFAAVGKHASMVSCGGRLRLEERYASYSSAREVLGGRADCHYRSNMVWKNKGQSGEYEGFSLMSARPFAAAEQMGWLAKQGEGSALSILCPRAMWRHGR